MQMKTVELHLKQFRNCVHIIYCDINIIYVFLDHPYKILIIAGSESAKTDALLNLINNKLDIHKIYLYAKDPYEAKYQFLINKRESTGLNHYDDGKAFIEYSTVCKTFKKILMIIIQIKNAKY